MNAVWRLALVTAVGALLLLPAVASERADLRFDSPWGERDKPFVPAQPFLEGKLTWNGNSRGISWAGAAASEDHRPTLGANDALGATLFRADRHLTQEGQVCPFFCLPARADAVTSGHESANAAPGVFEFESQPLPRDVIVNVTRGFQLQLFLLQNPAHLNAQGEPFRPCTEKQDRVRVDPPDPVGWFDVSEPSWMEPAIEAEVRADGRLIAGGYPTAPPFSQSIDQVWWSGIWRAPPEGYGMCLFQMHSEVPVLKAGTVLRLTLRHVMQQYPYPYGLAGDHHSALRIWEYPTAEVIYRRPDLLETPGTPAESSAAGLGAGLFLVPFLVGRHGGRVAIAAALLLAAGASGCLSAGRPSTTAGTSETLGGVVSNTFVRSVDNGETGAIAGIVHDDLRVPVGGVHVSIRGVSDFAKTDGRGRFQFDALPPGTHLLRFDHDKYVSYEAPVEVRAAFTSHPTVTLFLKDPSERDRRPHDHDYWEGRNAKSVGSVRLNSVCPEQATDPCQLPKRTFATVPVGNDPNTIFPGTTEVHVELDWDPARLGAQRLGLKVDSLDVRDAVFAPRGPKQPFVIQATWEMTDVGHVGFSSWTFEWIWPLSERPSWQEERSRRMPGYDPGAITARVSIVRGGTLPLEPGHPDHWKGADAIPLLKGQPFEMYGWSGSMLPPTSGDCLLPKVVDDLLWFCPHPYYSTRGFGHEIVPPETTYVEVFVEQSRDTVPSTGIDLYYRSARTPPHLSDDVTLAGYTKVTARPGANWLNRTFLIPLQAGDADFVYAKTSAWDITFRPQDETAMWLDATQEAYVSGMSLEPTPRLQYWFQVFMHRTPVPA